MARDMIEAPVDEQAQVRSRWITELRRQGHRQCRNTRRDYSGNVCGLELLWEVAGRPEPMFSQPMPQDFGFRSIGVHAGLRFQQTLEFVSRNDGRCGFRPHTFAELADWLEGLPRV